jgi:hypothetical protein
MKEDFIAYIWKFQSFSQKNLHSVQREQIQVLAVGQENRNSGPDFFNSQLIIGEQKWAGNVELHVKSSDWYVHGHEKDKNYDSVILHVVWDQDVDIYRKDKTLLPTLQLKKYVNKEVQHNYQKLFMGSRKWINCENDIAKIDHFVLDNWLERLYVERLEQKSKLISELLISSKNDWEAVLFKLLAKNFGLKVNGEVFFDWANSLDFNIIRRQQHDLEGLEALFFGHANLLKEAIEDSYYLHLQKEFAYIKSKFNLTERLGERFQFFRLRPNNFPTIRLAQLAALYNQHQNLFSKLMASNELKDFYVLFDVSISEYWRTHYSFTARSKMSSKKITKSFINLLLINTIIPLKFMYLRQHGKLNEDELLGLVREIKSEKNSIIDKFKTLKITSKNALESQALLQLKNEYCSKLKCLQCNIGNSIIINL